MTNKTEDLIEMIAHKKVVLERHVIYLLSITASSEQKFTNKAMYEISMFTAEAQVLIEEFNQLMHPLKMSIGNLERALDLITETQEKINRVGYRIEFREYLQRYGN